MSVTRTFTVTVASTDSGNKYVIDGVQQDTVTLGITGTFRFDQSNATNGNHPLRFSTTSDGTHSGGDEYTTNVTTNGVPGNSGAYTEISVTSATPTTLYYYCSQHPGMGGQANIVPAATWGALNWDENTWGSALLVPVGWGADPWNDAASTWGDVGGEIVQLTSPGAITSNVSVGSAYGDDTWGEEQGWGQFSLNPADVMGLTGVSATSSVGSLSDIVISATVEPTGQSFTSSVGSLDPADQVVGVTGQQATSNVGAITPAQLAFSITGVSATSDVGSVTIDSSPVISLTAPGAITVSSGAITPFDQDIGVTGVAFTSAVGTLTVIDQAVGLSGQQITPSVSTISIEANADIDTGSNTSYSNISTGSNTSYSDVATGSNTSYSDVA